MTKRWILALAFFGLAATVRADDLQKQIDDLRGQVETIRKSYGPAEPREASACSDLVADKIAAAVQDSVDGHLLLGLNMVGVYQNLIGMGNFGPDAQGNSRNANRGAGSGTLDLTFAGKPMLNALVFVDLNAGLGPGVDGLAGNSAVLNANYVGNGSPTVREAWMLVHMPGNVLSLQAGVIDLKRTFDSNAAANDETSQFLMGAFVNSPLLLNPANGPGAVARLELNSFCAKIAAQGTQTATGISDSIYGIAELGMRCNFYGDAQWRLWARQEPRGPGQPDQAIGLSIDHRITPELTTFCRYAKNSYAEDFNGVSDTAVNKYDWAASAGFELGNFMLMHLQDRIGFAYGRNDLQTGSHEDFSEIYYKTVLTPHFTISLHGQSVFNRVQASAGADELPNIFAMGLRTQVSY